MTLEGRRILVTGVLNQESLAWHAARDLQERGAELLLTSFGRMRRLTERAARDLPRPADVLDLDATKAEDYAALAEELGRRWDRVDGVVHAIGGAPEGARDGHFLTTTPGEAEEAFRVSAWSLHGLVTALLPLLRRAEGGASVVVLDFDNTTRAWAGYDWVGVSKAALQSVARYLALYAGRDAVRVNLVSPGPIETVSGRSHRLFPGLLARWTADAPLGWDPRDAEIVTGPIAFLLSGASRGMTGEVLRVDGGFHLAGYPVPDDWRAEDVA
ncbi:MAG: SDR family oxidoreductase [Solirubrobacterales bacterium]|nr:SDR family oxidoreductase [Solirubrobacterales bacterium]